MTLTPDPWWPCVVLAGVLVIDALLGVRPPAFVRACLDGVGFPEPWWWVLLVAKLLGAGGLLAGLWLPGVGLAANVGVVAYFCCAAAAHVRARFLRSSFWLNCLGMLALSSGVLVVSFVV